jgi:hypothetical protein
MSVIDLLLPSALTIFGLILLLVACIGQQKKHYSDKGYKKLKRKLNRIQETLSTLNKTQCCCKSPDNHDVVPTNAIYPTDEYISTP